MWWRLSGRLCCYVYGVFVGPIASRALGPLLIVTAAYQLVDAGPDSRIGVKKWQRVVPLTGGIHPEMHPCS